MPIKQSTLFAKAENYRQPVYESKRATFDSLKKSAFLCHSHKDDILVKGLLVMFQEAGVNLYIDWQDHTMPDIPNAETAKKIQEKICSCDLFLFLATANSKASRWCPWEIGYADSSMKKIYILPTSDGRVNYGNEYLDLYKRIDEGYDDFKTGLAIFEAKKTTDGSWLSWKTLY